eukprot:1925542-Pyramimonas_sp.AAC.1
MEQCPSVSDFPAEWLEAGSETAAALDCSRQVLSWAAAPTATRATRHSAGSAMAARERMATRTPGERFLIRRFDIGRKGWWRREGLALDLCSMRLSATVRPMGETPPA